VAGPAVSSRRFWPYAALAVVLAGAIIGLVTLCGDPPPTGPGPGPAADHAKCPPIKRPPTMREQARPAAVAGSWYPGKPTELAKLLDGMLAEAKPVELKGTGRVRALIAPHAGYRFSGPAAAAGYRLVKGQPICRVVILGPAHRGGFAGLSIPPVTHYTTPLGAIPLDVGVIARLRHHPMVQTHAPAHEREHSIEMQLPMLQRALGTGWSLVPILVGRLEGDSPARAAELLRLLADDRTLFVASSDFTHYGPNYGYQPFPKDEQVAERLRDLDMGAMRFIEARDSEGFQQYRDDTGITACGHGPVRIVLGMLPPSATATLVRYTTSGEVTGDYTNSVSYLTVAFTNETPLSFSGGSDDLPQGQLELLHQLARRALQQSVTSGSADLDADAVAAGMEIPVVLKNKRAAFVTLRKYGQLRGCIGHLQASEPLIESVVQNAVNAALRDRRFQPVTAGELGELTVEISVLSPTRAIPGADRFQVGKEGIILMKKGRRAVFLPEVAAEQGWNRAQTLTQLSRKAGLAPDDWQRGAQFEVFTAQVYEAPYQL